jgi:hypothetical protein
MRRFLIAGCLLLTALLPSPSALAVDAGAAGSGGGAGDFNGDGVADLAVGVPGEDVDGIEDAGAVNVLYGSAAGLTAAGDQLFSQDSPGVADVAEAGDRFGSAVAAGDFNGDGYADLAVGVPLEDVGTAQDAGAVTVLYGAAAGLTASGSQLFSQATPGVPDTAAAGEAFGLALAAANFGNGAQDDLAIGVPGVTQEDRSTIVGAGAVNLLYGSAAGLTTGGSQLFSQDSAGVAGTAEYADSFGLALAAADFGGSSQADLAVGVPGEDLGGLQDAGAINVLYGSAAGLTTTGDQLLTQDSPGIANLAEAGDEFGTALAAADFGVSGQADLAIGVPGEDLAGVVDAGAVNVVYGSGTGLAAAGNQLLSQATPGIANAPGVFDDFGLTLAVANFGNSSQADLAVGVPFEDAPDLDNVGAVNVIYGSAGGLAATGSQFFLHQHEAFAGAWLTLTAANYGRSAHGDLAVGIPDEEVGDLLQAGAVTVLYGSAAGLTRTNEEFFTQDSPGVADLTEAGDLYGCATPFCALGFSQPD